MLKREGKGKQFTHALHGRLRERRVVNGLIGVETGVIWFGDGSHTSYDQAVEKGTGQQFSKLLYS